MQSIKQHTHYLYTHPLVRYVLVGGSTFALDFALLVFLKQEAGLSLPVSTSIAYWVAIIYNFILNRLWTFSVSDRENLHRHLMNYLVLLGFNYLFTVIFVSLLGRHIYFGAAKALAVIIQTTWTYHIYKRYIFVR